MRSKKISAALVAGSFATTSLVGAAIPAIAAVAVAPSAHAAVSTAPLNNLSLTYAGATKDGYVALTGQDAPPQVDWSWNTAGVVAGDTVTLASSDRSLNINPNGITQITDATGNAIANVTYVNGTTVLTYTQYAQESDTVWLTLRTNLSPSSSVTWENGKSRNVDLTANGIVAGNVNVGFAWETTPVTIGDALRPMGNMAFRNNLIIPMTQGNQANLVGQEVVSTSTIRSDMQPYLAFDCGAIEAAQAAGTPYMWYNVSTQNADGTSTVTSANQYINGDNSLNMRIVSCTASELVYAYTPTATGQSVNIRMQTPTTGLVIPTDEALIAQRTGPYTMYTNTVFANGFSAPTRADGSLTFSNADGRVTTSPDTNPDTNTVVAGSAVTNNVAANDVPSRSISTLDLTSVKVKDPATGLWVDSFTTTDGVTVTTDDNGNIVVSTPEDYTGTQIVVDYQIADSTTGTATSTLTVAVAQPVTLNPSTANPDVATTPYRTPVTADVIANDTTDPSVTYNTSTLQVKDSETGEWTNEFTSPEGDIVSVVDGAVVVTPAKGRVGDYAVDYQVNDSNGSAVGSQLVVAVGEPTISVEDATVWTNEQVVIPVVLGPGVTADEVQPSQIPVGFTYDPASSTLTGSSAAPLVSEWTVTVNVFQGQGAEVTNSNVTDASIVIVNSPSLAPIADQTVKEKTSIANAVPVFNGPDSADVTIEGQLPEGVTWNADTNALSGTPSANTGSPEGREYNLVAVYSDEFGNEIRKPFTITVTEDAPVVTPTPEVTPEPQNPVVNPTPNVITPVPGAVIPSKSITTPQENHYDNCEDAGYKVRAGEAGYRFGLDRDKDGIGCEAFPEKKESVIVNTGETGTDQALLGLGAAASSLGLAGLIGFRKRNRS